MKTFLLSATILVFVLILIIFFQNLASSVNGLWILFFYFNQNSSAPLAIAVIASLGFASGALSTMLILNLINQSKDEEAPGGSNW